MTLFEQIGQFYNAYISIVLDVCLVAFLVYHIYRIIEKTHSFQLLKGSIILFALYALTWLLELSTLKLILEILSFGLLIAIAIVFQPEIRRIFLQLGKASFSFSSKKVSDIIDPVLDAAENLSALRRGMLVVFLRRAKLEEYYQSGTMLDALLSQNLLLTIFTHDTALHDGSVLIQDNRIVAASVFLPLSDRNDIRKTFGTRHRAALGLAEKTDAVTLIVSEESGAISLAFDSELYYDLSKVQIREILMRELNIKEDNAQKEVTHG